MPTYPKLVISMGDPAGIGPEIIVKALRNMKDLRRVRLAVVGEPGVMERAVRVCRGRMKITPVNQFPDQPWSGKRLPVLSPWPGPLDIAPGHWSKTSGESSYVAVKLATELCLRGQADALVTAPICKEAWHAAGVRFPGHTELLTSLTKTRSQVAMMFVNGPFRLILVTIHEPLARVPQLLTRSRITRILQIGAEELRHHFGIRTPHIAVAGFNPHAGEAGLFGQEEIRIIRPALRSLEKQGGMRLTGPLPPDTLFAEALHGEGFDLIACMYHDQGLIPFKMLALHQGVNVTAGLPIIRTSPDHGTAFDLAGTGRANAGSMEAAIRTALEMASRERRQK
jgi:4-hydroxythreonine-4-phosphate dehydrogenase